MFILMLNLTVVTHGLYNPYGGKQKPIQQKKELPKEEKKSTDTPVKKVPKSISSQKEKQETHLRLPKPIISTLTRIFSEAQVKRFKKIKVEGDVCFVSKVIKSDHQKGELNYHRIMVDYEGNGVVKISLGHSGSGDFANILKKRHLRSSFVEVKSKTASSVTSSYKGENNIWIMIKVTGSVKINQIRLDSWQGEGALFGHFGGSYLFAGQQLPFRLMYPKNYDPKKKYPLVISSAGSGSVGIDNIKNMEKVIAATYLFKKYYDQPQYDCFSLVPQMPPKGGPYPYWPKGMKGASSQMHPQYEIVNQEGWYVQGTLSLIDALVKHPQININEQRIYLTGFSYGGKAVWEFMKAAPDLFAGVHAVAGWAIGPLGSTPQGVVLAALRAEVDQYKHIPIRIFVGDKDKAMLAPSIAVAQCLKNAGSNTDIAVFKGVSHVSTAGRVWGKADNMKWLFAQKLK
jgi:dienelactone hydrolase